MFRHCASTSVAALMAVGAATAYMQRDAQVDAQQGLDMQSGYYGLKYGGDVSVPVLRRIFSTGLCNRLV